MTPPCVTQNRNNESLVILNLERIVTIWRGRAKQNRQVTTTKIRKTQADFQWEGAFFIGTKARHGLVTAPAPSLARCLSPAVKTALILNTSHLPL